MKTWLVVTETMKHLKNIVKDYQDKISSNTFYQSHGNSRGIRL